MKYVANVNSYPKWTVLVSYFWCNNELLFVQIDSRYSILRTYFAWCIFKRFRKSLHCITYCNKENLLFNNLCFVNGKHLLHSGFHFYLFPLKFLEMLAKHDEFIPGKFIYVLEGKFYDFLLLRLLTVAFFLKLVTANLLDRYI